MTLYKGHCLLEVPALTEVSKSYSRESRPFGISVKAVSFVERSIILCPYLRGSTIQMCQCTCVASFPGLSQFFNVDALKNGKAWYLKSREVEQW